MPDLKEAFFLSDEGERGRSSETKEEREHPARELSQTGQKPRRALRDGEWSSERVRGSSLDAENGRSEGPGYVAPVGGDREQQKQEVQRKSGNSSGWESMKPHCRGSDAS